MSYQTFTASTVEDAKRAMRQALGDDAVILATRRHSDGTVELRGIQKGNPLFKGEGGSGGGLFGQTRERTAPEAPSLGGGHDVRNEHPNFGDERDMAGRAESSAGRNAMTNLRGDFSRKLDRNAEFSDPLHQRLHSVLSPQGLTPPLIAALAEEAHHAGTSDETQMLAFGLERTLKFAPTQPSPDQPIMLVGQTGAGKTSSAAKLAARSAGMGGRAIFMSADVGRAGAIEQMTTYAEALDTRFWPIEDPEHVAEILRNERPREQIIFDTPGVSPYASADVAAVRAFREVLGAEPILVIPASGDVNEHMDWVRAFADIGVRRVIVTKFDTSRRVGAALSGAYHAGVALAHLSEAPFIADGLIDAEPEYLAYRLLLDQPGRIAARR